MRTLSTLQSKLDNPLIKLIFDRLLGKVNGSACSYLNLCQEETSASCDKSGVQVYCFVRHYGIAQPPPQASPSDYRAKFACKQKIKVSEPRDACGRGQEQHKFSAPRILNNSKLVIFRTLVIEEINEKPQTDNFLKRNQLFLADTICLFAQTPFLYQVNFHSTVQ